MAGVRADSVAHGIRHDLFLRASSIVVAGLAQSFVNSATPWMVKIVAVTLSNPFTTPEISECEVILSIIVQLGTYWLLQGSWNSTIDFLYVGNVTYRDSGIILAFRLSH